MKDHSRGTPGGMGSGKSGSTSIGKGKVVRHAKRPVSRGGGNMRGGLRSAQVKSAHNRRKMNNQKIISSMRKS